MTPESEIPEDIRATARAIRDKLCVDCECTFDRGCGCLDALHEALLAEREATNQRWRDSDEAAREAGFMLGPFDVAEAVMAERERCAEIVRPFTMQGGTGGAFVRKAMWSVLDAIRQDNPNET